MEKSKSSFQPLKGIPTLEGVSFFERGTESLSNGDSLKHARGLDVARAGGPVTGLFDVSTKSHDFLLTHRKDQ
jgi:hypothetical protein